MEKTFEYRIYPNASQRQLIARTFGCCRWTYNRALDVRMKSYEAGVPVPSINSLIMEIPRLKKETETAWLGEVDSIALQQSLRDLDKAYRNFFRAPGKVGFPKFKSKRNARRSYRTNNVRIVDERHLKLPKLGIVKARISRPVEGRMLSATIKQAPSGKYFVAVCCTDCAEAPLPETDQIIGIDCGLHDLIITSEGTRYDNPKYYKKSKAKLAKEQRKLSRKQGARKGEKPSNNYKKQRKKVACIHERVANQRKDNLHKTTTRLINENQVVVAESLKVQNMKRNHHLAQAISDAAWGELCRQLDYKAAWYGRTFVQIGSFFPSSQTCSNCGAKNPAVKDLKVREWACESCGAEHDRDVNAAKTILQEGMRMIGWDTPESNACEENVRPIPTFVGIGESR